MQMVGLRNTRILTDYVQKSPWTPTLSVELYPGYGVGQILTSSNVWFKRAAYRENVTKFALIRLTLDQLRLVLHVWLLEINVS